MAKNVVLLENVNLMFRHFSGKKDNFHAEGQRDFVVRLDKEMAALLERDGFVVKWLEPREDGDEPTPTLKVRANFNGEYPPQVTMVTSRNKTRLDKESVELLDYAEIITADLFITPYDWTVNGKSGRTAYLDKLFVTIREDELEQKYSDIPYSDEVFDNID